MDYQLVVVQVPAGTREFALLQSVQTVPGALRSPLLNEYDELRSQG
jgi:hypothetical protein